MKSVIHKHHTYVMAFICVSHYVCMHVFSPHVPSPIFAHVFFLSHIRQTITSVGFPTLTTESKLLPKEQNCKYNFNKNSVPIRCFYWLLAWGVDRLCNIAIILSGPTLQPNNQYGDLSKFQQLLSWGCRNTFLAKALPK